MTGRRFEVKTNRTFKAALPYVLLAAMLAVAVLSILALLDVVGWWVPLLTAALLVPRVGVLYLGARFGLYVIFHDRRVDLRVPAEKGKLALPYELVVSYRDLPDDQVEIAHLLTLNDRDWKGNLRSVIFQPDDPAGVLEEIRTRLDMFVQMGWAPPPDAGSKAGRAPAGPP